MTADDVDKTTLTHYAPTCLAQVARQRRHDPIVREERVVRCHKLPPRFELVVFLAQLCEANHLHAHHERARAPATRGQERRVAHLHNPLHRLLRKLCLDLVRRILLP